jgi:N4-acetylcytidine amidohydrolase
MTALPEKTCSIARLITQPKLVTAVLAGIKTQQRRDGVYGWPGEVFTLGDSDFVITSLHRQRLGDMTDVDAKAEGYDDLQSYQAIILKMHANMVWNDDGLAWVHSFERQA